MHPAKRRKLEQVNATLNKPFRSPLRTRPRTEPSLPTPSLSTLRPRRLGCPPTPASNNSSSPNRYSAKDPEVVELQKQHSVLSRQLTTLRQSLDTAQQALKIESGNQDTELEALVDKWRNVAREAAEELFATAKDRVNRMGGVGVWREKTQKKPDSWQEEQEFDESLLTDEQKEELEFQRDEANAEAEKYGLKEPKQTEEEKDDDSFTMDMMLQQMNVELDVIGYDKQLQRWVE